MSLMESPSLLTIILLGGSILLINNNTNKDNDNNDISYIWRVGTNQHYCYFDAKKSRRGQQIEVGRLRE